MALRHLIVKNTFSSDSKLFDWTDIEDSMWTWDKNHLT